MKHTVTPLELASGSKGLLINVPGSTVVELEFTFLSGFDYAPRGKFELPHSMEHLIMGANQHYTSRIKFSRELEKNGAYTNAYTSHLLNGYIATAPEFEWRRVAELFWQGLTSPLFLPREFKTEHETVREELYGKLEHHGLMLHVAMRRALGQSELPDYRERIKLLPNVEPSDLSVYHSRTHSAGNMRFIIGGGLNGKRPQIERLLQSYTGLLEPGARSIVRPLDLVQTQQAVTLTRDVDKVYFDIKLARRGELTQREEAALSLLTHALTISWDSRLFGKARELGLVYDIGSNGNSASGLSVYTIAGTVVPSKAERLFKLIGRELKKIKAGGITKIELERAKKYMIGNFQISHQTPHSLLNWYSRYVIYDDHYDFFGHDELIASITKPEVDTLIESLTGPEAKWAAGVLARDPQPAAEALHQQVGELWK